MHLVPINNAKPGMMLGKTIFREDDGKILLVKNTILKNEYIHKIKNLGYEYIYIRDPLAFEEDDELIPPIKDETKVKAIQVLKSTVQQIAKKEEMNIRRVKNVIVEVVDQILSDRQVIYNLSDLNQHDNYTYFHSVNVTVLSLLIGSELGISRGDLEILGMGAMMHDIGKTLIAPELLNKPERLDSREFESMKEHARNGFELLKDKLPSFVPAHIALQHHEREDGSGYPRGATGKNIHRFSKIVAVADVFDAITTNRSYQKARSPFEAIRQLTEEIEVKFERNIVGALSKVIAPFPVGSTLRFKDGFNGVVTFVSRTKCLVNLLDGPFKGDKVDLYRTTELQVLEVVKLFSEA